MVRNGRDRRGVAKDQIGAELWSSGNASIRGAMGMLRIVGNGVALNRRGMGRSSKGREWQKIRRAGICLGADSTRLAKEPIRPGLLKSRFALVCERDALIRLGFD